MKNGTTNGLCSESILERPRYFPRQLMTPAEMTLEQRFFLDKMRRHNRLLHGWGIVCGARVRQALDTAGMPIPWTVEIEPGYVLAPDGNEIVIGQTVTYNLRREAVNGHQGNGTGADPWCSDVPKDRPVDEVIYVAVCYAECEARPVRVHPAGCGCDETDCEYSRIYESFVIKGLSNLPEAYHNMPPMPGLDAFLMCNEPEPCPPCPEDKCVILADVTPDAAGNLTIDCLTHRRYVVSFANYYILCQRSGEQKAQMEERLRLHIDNEGMQMLAEMQGGQLEAAVRLPFSTIQGLSAESEVGVALQEMTVGQVAKMPFDKYQELVTVKLQDIPPAKRRYFERNAKEFWTRAREVSLLTQPYQTR